MKNMGSSRLVNNAIQYASEIIEISNRDISVIKHSRKAQLFINSQPWENKSGDSNFDVPMGCYDGAEVCELVGIYILNNRSNIIDKGCIGLYRDGGLGEPLLITSKLSS